MNIRGDGRSENLGGQSLMEHIFILIWLKSGGRGKYTLASMVLPTLKSFMKLCHEQLMFQFSISWKVMFISNDIRRKWNRMGTLLKLYIRIFTVVFVAIFVLSLDKLSRKRKSYEYRTTLDQRIQERIQRGMLINDLIIWHIDFWKMYLIMYSDEALEISYRHEEVRRITTTSMVVDLEKPKVIGKYSP